MKKLLITLTLLSTLSNAQDALGGIVGGAIGGVIGNQFGGGSGKVAATIAGATLGTMIGSTNQRIYTSDRYSHDDNDYPTRVVYREIPQQVVYTQPRVVYVYADRERGWHGHKHHRKYAKCDHDRWHDDD